MIAYNPIGLGNLYIREQAAEAFQQDCLDKAGLELINNKYQVHFYSPNFFIRIGLFILTTVILLFSFGLLLLLFLSSIEHAAGALAIFFAVLSYAALEYMVQTKKHFLSGADDALLWLSACSLFGGIGYLTDGGILANCLIIFVITLYCSLRFADRLMSVVWYISLLGILFFASERLGYAAKAFVAFVLMAVSAIVYLWLKRFRQSKINHLYSNCLNTISVSALLSFYLSGNYFVVKEVSASLFNLSLVEKGAIPFGWFFWLFTVIVPLLYIARGLQKKDIGFIRIGLILVAVIIFTVRYYYSIAPIEVILTAGGILLVAVSYGIGRLLKTPLYGFTSLEKKNVGTTEKLALEAILLAQTFKSQPVNLEGTSFGGGSFGGCGASGEY